MKYNIVLISIIAIFSCKEVKVETSPISLICVRDFDTLHIKILNNSKDTIYITSDFTGTFNTDGDTIFFEVVDKPKYNTEYFYRYSKIFPFEIYTARKIAGQVADTTIKVVYQTYYFNQFRVSPFLAIYPDSTFIQSMVFKVPKGANIARAVYYRKSFSNWLGQDSSNYLLKDFVRFDSLNAKYVSTPIMNRFYFK